MRDVWKLIGWLRESLQELLPADYEAPVPAPAASPSESPAS
jgi:hypothetical protein